MTRDEVLKELKFVVSDLRHHSPERRLEREEDALAVSSQLSPLKGPRK